MESYAISDYDLSAINPDLEAHHGIGLDEQASAVAQAALQAAHDAFESERTAAAYTVDASHAHSDTGGPTSDAADGEPVQTGAKRKRKQLSSCDSCTPFNTAP